MRYTVDCEFDGHGGTLISLALVPEFVEYPEEALYMITTEAYSPIIQDEWVKQNVLPILYHRLPCDAGYCPEFRVGAHIRKYLKNDLHPVIIADSPVDIWRFCELLTSTETYEWQSTEFPRMTFEVRNVECWPNNLGPDAKQHNAYWDAVALWEKINAADDTRKS